MRWIDRWARRRHTALVAALLSAVVLMIVAAGAEGGLGQLPDVLIPDGGQLFHHRHRRAAPPLRGTVALEPGAALTVPASFFGLSTEYRALATFERSLPEFERVLALLHTRGNGPLLLRIGGDSADHSFWDPRALPMPDWAYALTPEWLTRTSALLHETGARVILDLNLVTSTPGLAAEWARAADHALPAGAIAALEVGNEPDIYSQAFWRGELALGGTVGDPFTDLPRALTPDAYVRDFDAYARALRRAVPHVPLAGPALADPVTDRGWLSVLLRHARRSLALVTIHRYPYSACALPGTAAYATVGRLLSGVGTWRMAADLGPDLAIAHHYGLPLRLSELNSVTCGGRPGVSNSFATALWAPDALFSLLRAGVSGVNLHVRDNAINAPFSLGPAGLSARPLLYGLILFVRALGSHPQLVPVRYRGAGDLHVWAVHPATGGVNIVIINKGPRAVRVRLSLPDVGRLQVQRLLAPRPSADSGVTLDGQHLDRSGTWLGRPRALWLSPGTGGYRVTVRGDSAALVVARRAYPAITA